MSVPALIVSVSEDEAALSPVRLDECPPGLFLWEDVLGFKSEYREGGQPEAFVVESGEFFWGGTSTFTARNAVRVTPLVASLTPNPKPANP